ncbi:transmembrane electron transporter [Desulfurococcus sp.]|uniref:transmembrane electron transporter n=1 Tax=Desulfurococcus sp. TaxID=51678 RepID=UPI003169920B
MDPASFIPMLATMALIDSVDPCFFILYTGILISYVAGSMRKLVEISVVFILTVFTGYWVFGFLLRNVFSRVLVSPIYIFIIMIIYGVSMIIYGFHDLAKERNSGGDEICREDMVECNLSRRIGLQKLLETGGLIYIALTGFIASFTLLPCSAGMYIIYNMLTSDTPFPIWAFYTFLYTAIFVSPLVLITLIYIGIMKTRIHEKLIKHQASLRILGGLIAVAIAVYVYLYR